MHNTFILESDTNISDNLIAAGFTIECLMELEDGDFEIMISHNGERKVAIAILANLGFNYVNN